MEFNEDTRVKIPAILHLTRLGYQYLSPKSANWNQDTNIFPSIFKESILRINEDLEEKEAERLLDEVSLLLDYEDLGKAFHERLVSNSGLKLIDFEDFDRNQFHVITELPCINGEEEFRPDITLLINGMPLVFIEVKKPNNLNGVIAERDRINTRSQNKKFRRFINATQFMIFSNNMEYDNDAIHQLQGAFYATSSYSETNFNYFREEEVFNLGQLLSDPDDALENLILRDNNKVVIKPEPVYGNSNKKNYKVRSAILILHDVGDKEYREDAVLDFKAGKVDFFFVYNMLLTGFDAKRLKKIYLGRVVKQHNLLQTLTRVNRTYKNFRYG